MPGLGLRIQRLGHVGLSQQAHVRLLQLPHALVLLGLAPLQLAQVDIVALHRLVEDVVQGGGRHGIAHLSRADHVHERLAQVVAVHLGARSQHKSATSLRAVSELLYHGVDAPNVVRVRFRRPLQVPDGGHRPRMEGRHATLHDARERRHPLDARSHLLIAPARLGQGRFVLAQDRLVVIGSRLLIRSAAHVGLLHDALHLLFQRTHTARCDAAHILVPVRRQTLRPVEALQRLGHLHARQRPLQLCIQARHRRLERVLQELRLAICVQPHGDVHAIRHQPLEPGLLLALRQVRHGRLDGRRTPLHSQQGGAHVGQMRCVRGRGQINQLIVLVGADEIRVDDIIQRLYVVHDRRRHGSRARAPGTLDVRRGEHQSPQLIGMPALRKIITAFAVHSRRCKVPPLALHVLQPVCRQSRRRRQRHTVSVQSRHALRQLRNRRVSQSILDRLLPEAFLRLCEHQVAQTRHLVLQRRRQRQRRHVCEAPSCHLELVRSTLQTLARAPRLTRRTLCMLGRDPKQHIRSLSIDTLVALHGGRIGKAWCPRKGSAGLVFQHAH